MKYLLVIAALVVGNFVYQVWHPFSAGPQWGTALERSYFQGMAVLVCSLTFRF